MATKGMDELRARDVMSDATHMLRADAPAVEAGQSFKANRITGAPVIDEDGHVVGVLSVTDLLSYENGADISRKGTAGLYHVSDLIRALELDEEQCVRSLRGIKVDQLMTRNFVSTLSSTPLPQVAALMLEHKVRRVLVIDGGRMMGIVTHTDILKALARRS